MVKVCMCSEPTRDGQSLCCVFLTKQFPTNMYTSNDKFSLTIHDILSILGIFTIPHRLWSCFILTCMWFVYQWILLLITELIEPCVCLSYWESWIAWELFIYKHNILWLLMIKPLVKELIDLKVCIVYSMTRCAKIDIYIFPSMITKWSMMYSLYTQAITPLSFHVLFTHTK